MKLSDFDFELPENLVATRPAKPRSSSRLLVAFENSLKDSTTVNLAEFLRPGDRLVMNDTKVIPARLTGNRCRKGPEGSTEAKIEATLLEPQSDGTWTTLLKPLRKVRDGETIVFSPDLSATVESRMQGTANLRFNLVGDDFDAALKISGAMPLPPYIEAIRKSDDQDREDYQSLWAKKKGAVAAPTASLHFDDELINNLVARGIDRSFVTLHVGAGTFLPVKVDDLRDHKMHSEKGLISKQAAEEINTTRANGGRIIPIGTTALRLIETAATPDGTLATWEGATDIFITPGYQFRITDALMTNFHLPKSTLMMLVSAFAGSERVKEIYAHAIENEYRFFSYGDASLLMPKG